MRVATAGCVAAGVSAAASDDGSASSSRVFRFRDFAFEGSGMVYFVVIRVLYFVSLDSSGEWWAAVHLLDELSGGGRTVAATRRLYVDNAPLCIRSVYMVVEDGDG